MDQLDPHAEPVVPRREPRQVWRRLRWRLRGAWQWPSFVVLTPVGAVVLSELPFYEPGPANLFAAVLLAGFANLLAVAVLAPLAGRLLRRRRPDLPRIVARDYAGAALLAAIFVALVAGGLLHRPAAASARAERSAVLAGVHSYVLGRAPQLSDRIAQTDMIRLEDDLYRACVPTGDPRRWLCLIVSTAQDPPRITRDRGEEPNDVLRLRGSD